MHNGLPMLARDVIDERDWVLLRLLRHNARASIAELAVAAGLAPSSVHERIRRLERRGVIRRWTVEVDPDAVGTPVTAFVGLEATGPSADVARALREVAGVDECHSMGGEPSFLLKVRVADHEALLALVDELRALPAVTGVQPTVALRTHFERGPQPGR
jgi:DNA-binding Lrp family transcriptional regulator